MSNLLHTGIAARPLVLMRWAAIVGQLLVLLVASFHYHYDLAVIPALICIAALAALNFCATFHMPKGQGGFLFTESAVRASIIFDSVQLSGLLFFTGGIENPFVMLLVAPLTVGATLLPSADVAKLLVITLLGAALQFFSPFTLNWDNAQTLPVDYLGGLWFALLVTVVFVASYVWSVTAERRRLADALDASEDALAKAQRASDIGALAAAIAHEISTPLGTITIIAKELATQQHADPALADDIKTLVAETTRCRTILADLSNATKRISDNDLPRMTLEVLLTSLFEPYQKPGLHFDIEGKAATTLVQRQPALSHGLANLLSNAADFARTRITAVCHNEDKKLIVTITDDGPGFAPALLQRLGEPYMTQRSDEGTHLGPHLGLGVFIATTLLERTGANMAFDNAPSGGARVSIVWPDGIK